MSTVRPILTELDLGSAGWRALHEEARQRRRKPNAQAVALIRYALHRKLAGYDVELTQSQLDALLEQQSLEQVA
jgi:hypothetical protein